MSEKFIQIPQLEARIVFNNLSKAKVLRHYEGMLLDFIHEHQKPGEPMAIHLINGTLLITSRGRSMHSFRIMGEVVRNYDVWVDQHKKGTKVFRRVRPDWESELLEIKKRKLAKLQIELQPDQLQVFFRMYPNGVTPDKIDWAIQQCYNTIYNNTKGRK